MKEITKALLKVQEEITNPPNTARNPFFKSKYAPLPDILNLVRPILTKNDLFLYQNTGSDGESAIYVQTIIMHKSGELLQSDKLSLVPDKKTPQGIGSAITYGRRYQLSAMLGISSEDDDDGEGAEKREETALERAQRKAEQKKGKKPKAETVKEKPKPKGTGRKPKSAKGLSTAEVNDLAKTEAK